MCEWVGWSMGTWYKASGLGKLLTSYLRWVRSPGAGRSVEHRPPSVVEAHVVHLPAQVVEVLKERSSVIKMPKHNQDH